MRLLLVHVPAVALLLLSLLLRWLLRLLLLMLGIHAGRASSVSLRLGTDFEPLQWLRLL
jgi:hypothetical protein